MFNIVGSIKKVIGISKKLPAEKKAEKESTKEKLTVRFSKVSNFINEKIYDAIAEYHLIRKKMKNLYQTNYDLGMRHLESGNISEAAFRFKIVKKFWPDHYDSYYQLAYCLVLLGKFAKAKIIIDELLAKNSDYKDKVTELLSAIEDEDTSLKLKKQLDTVS